MNTFVIIGIIVIITIFAFMYYKNKIMDNVMDKMIAAVINDNPDDLPKNLYQKDIICHISKGEMTCE